MKLQTLLKEEIVLPMQFGVTEESETIRNELLAQSRKFTVAQTIAEANCLSVAARDIRTMISQVRALGLDLRRPLNAAAEKIKRLEDDYLKPLLAEQERCESIAGAFAAKEKARVQEEERLRQAEIARVEQERIAAENHARAEAARVERENREAAERARREQAEAEAREKIALEKLEAMKGKLYEGENYEIQLVKGDNIEVIGFTDDEFGGEASPKNLPKGVKLKVVKLDNAAKTKLAKQTFAAKQKIAAEQKKIDDAREQSAREQAERDAEAARKRAEADMAAQEARKKIEASQAVIRAPLPEAAKVAGMTTKRVMQYEVTDLNALVKARPELCKIDPKPSAIVAVCVPRFPKDSNEIDSTSVPGLKLWWADSTSTRKW